MMRKATGACVIAVASCLALLGSACNNGQKAAQEPVKAEHPQAEHPKAEGEQPKAEHPKDEHPKEEHPKDDGGNR